MKPQLDAGWLNLVEQASRILLGLVFLLYGVDKIPHPDNFARAIANYRMLPGGLVNLLAVVLPWIEVLCGLLLLSGQWVRSAALVSAFLLAVFVIAVSVALARGLDINCGCFDAHSGRRIGLRVLGEDFLFLALSVVLILKARDRVGWKALLGIVGGQK
jgi:putative oxidoreductase